MPRRNLTLALDENLLLEARAVAAKQHTSINDLVRRYLESLVGENSRRLAAWEGVRTLVETPRARVRGPLPLREQVHER